jgi:hypothetical protein
MAYDNKILTDDELSYKPYSTAQGSVDMTKATRASSDKANIVRAEFSFGRMMIDHDARLIVKNKLTGTEVFSIPLIDYVLLVKSNYKSHWGDQEFLDRQDEYNMTFFLDEAGRWISSSIVVNSWRVVLNNQTIN